jgi:hypothetical protein
VAQYFTDFSEYTTGVQPSDFTERWDTASVTATVETVADTTGGKVLEFVNAGGPAAISWDEIDSDPNRDDVEILTRVRKTSGGGSDIRGILARAVNTEATRTGYFTGLSSTDVKLSRYLSGGYNNFAGAASSPIGWAYVKGKFSGASLKVKAWNGAIGDEPVAWDIETTNSDISAAGWVGFFNFNGSTTEYDILSVGTNGDVAPTSAVATGPDTPINPSITNLLATSARLNWEQG